MRTLVLPRRRESIRDRVNLFTGWTGADLSAKGVEGA